MINHKLMKKFLCEALKTLDGEWIIIGGTVLPLMGVDHRVTMDIDLVNLNFKSSNQQTFQLMEIAQSIGLPVEAINQAGAFFLSKMEDVNDHLILLEKSKNCTIYRPDAYLYIKLKITRLSETDMEDCLLFLKKNKSEASIYNKQIEKLLRQKLKHADAEAQVKIQKILNSLKP